MTGSSPASGPLAGGTLVTIKGISFTGASRVTFGAVNASYNVDDDFQITATAPPGAGTVGITVYIGQQGSIGPGAQFTYVSTPTVTNVTPNAGPAGGGNSVSITGTNFSGTAGAGSIKFGGTNATSYTVNSDTQITAVAPPGNGRVDVRVTNNGETSATSANTVYDFVAPPTVALSVASPIFAGGTSTATWTLSNPNALQQLGGVGVTTSLPANLTVASLPNVSNTCGGSVSAGAGATSVSLSGGVINQSASCSFSVGLTSSIPGIYNITPGSPSAQTPVSQTGAPGPTATLIVNAAATQIAVNGGNGQSAQVTNQFAAPLSAVVRDANNNPVSGVTVTFTPPGNGASGSFSGGNTAVTNASGIATSSAFTANTVAGSYNVVASIASGATANFALTNTAGAPQRLVINGGNSQSATVGTQFATPLSVVVVDTFGNATGAGSQVNFQIQTGVSGASGTFAGGSTSASANTNASGVATAPAITANATAGNFVVLAFGFNSVTFSLTNTAPPPTVASIAPSSGPTTGGTSVTITGTDFTGATGVTIKGAAATGVIVDSATQIRATTPAGAAGPASVLVTTPTGTNAANTLYTYIGPPSQITATAGTPQSATVGTSFATALQATVRDAANNPVSGVTVVFTAPAAGASGAFANSTNTTNAVTDATGVATASAFTANTAIGTYNVSATALGGTNPSVNFALTNTAVALTTTQAVPSTVLTAGTAATAFTPVTASGGFGTLAYALSGGTLPTGLNFATTSGQIAGTPTTLLAQTTFTVTVTDQTTPTAQTSSKTFNLTVNAPALTTTQAVASTVLTAGTATTAFTPVTASGGFGTLAYALSGGTLPTGLTFSTTSGQISGTPTTLLAQTTFTVTVTDQSTPTAQTSSKTFNLTVNAGAASSIAVGAGNNQSATINTAFATQLAALVKDANGNPVQGATVTFAPPGAGASGAFAGGANTAVTNASGVATAAVFTANATAGSYSVSASVPGVGPLPFSLTNTPGAASQVAATAGTPQSATVNTAFGTQLQATVKDASGNTVSGASVTFTAPNAGASGTFTGGALTATINTNPAGIATAPVFTANGTPGGPYNVVASIAGGAFANFALTNTATAPTVTTNPVSQSAAATSTVMFTAAASGVPSPTVQWQVSTNGGAVFSNIAGATAPTLSVTVQTTDNGNQYRAVFTNAAGSATTTAATLTVTAGPQITQNPVNATVNAGQSATFTAAASGNPAPTVQWQISTDGGSTFANVAGATSASLTVTAAATDNGNRYRAVFTNGSGSATTSAATLKVNFAPTVTTNPVSQSVASGATVTFTAAASGIPTPMMQWQVSTNGGATFTNIAGAASTALTFTAQATDNGNQYRAVFTNTVGSATTTAATMTVTAGPQVTQNPANATVNAGQSATFTAAASGLPAPTVQWQISTDGGGTFTNVAGATSASLTVTAAATDNGNRYRAVFTNGSGSATTSAATLTVNTAPTVTTNPVSQSVMSGANVTFTAAASGNPSPTVQWQVSSNGGGTFTNVAGATSPSLTFAAQPTDNGNQYRAIFTNSVGSATTTAATLTVTSVPTITLIAPNSGPTAGGTSVIITGTNLTGATAVLFGASSAASFVVNSATQITAIAPAGSGTVDVRITTPGGTSAIVAADKFTYIVPAPTVTSISPNSGPTAGGTSVTITGTNFTGATSVTIGGVAATNLVVVNATTITAATPAHAAGVVDVAVTTPGGMATGTGLYTYVTPAPTVTSISPNSGPTAGGTSVTITGTNFTGATSVKFGTANAASFTVNAATTITAISPAGTGTVDVTVTTAGGTSATSAADQFNYTAVPVVTTNPASQTAAAGATVTFTAAASGTPAPTVQWQVSTNNGGSFTNIAGATNTTLTFATQASDNGNQYRAVFTNAVGSANTAAATLTVNTLPVVATNPASQTVLAGANVSFTAAANGTPAPTVQWQVSTNNGGTFANIAGATGTTLSFTAQTTDTANQYRAVFTNSVGSVNTTAATLTVTPIQTTTTTVSSSLNPSAAGQAVTFTANVTAASGTPSGNVTFSDGGIPIGTAALAGGVATLTTSALSAGTHTIIASYAGAATFTASTSAALTQTVGAPVDSVRLRQLQVLVTPTVAQVSGQAITGAIDTAISEGFSGGGTFVTPNGGGVRFNFAADPESQGNNTQANAQISPRNLDPFSSVSGSLNASGRGVTSAAANNANARLDDSFDALGYAKRERAPPRNASTSAAASEPREWFGWAEIRGAVLDRWSVASTFGVATSTAAILYGNQVNMLVGLTRKFTPNFLMGVVGGYETFDYRSDTLAGRLKGDGWSVGAYAGWLITSSIRADAALVYSGIGYDGTSGLASGSFTGKRILASGGITGNYDVQGVRLEPSARVYALWEHENAYTDTLGTLQTARDFATGRASSGLKAAYPIAWSDTLTIAPYAGLYADYYFNKDNAGTLGVTPGAIPTGVAFAGWSARATGGVAASFAGGAQLNVGAERSGLGANLGFWVYRARGSLPFSAQ